MKHADTGINHDPAEIATNYNVVKDPPREPGLSPQERELDLYERILQVQKASAKFTISRALLSIVGFTLVFEFISWKLVVILMVVYYSNSVFFPRADVLKGYQATSDLCTADIPILIMLLDSADRQVQAVARLRLARLFPLVAVDDPLISQLSYSQLAILETCQSKRFWVITRFERELTGFMRKVRAHRKLDCVPNLLQSVVSRILPSEREKAAALREEQRNRARAAYLRTVDAGPVAAVSLAPEVESRALPESHSRATSPTVRRHYFIAASIVFVPYGVVGALLARSSSPAEIPFYMLVAAAPLVLARYTLWSNRSSQVLQLCRMRDCGRVGELIDVLQWPDEHILRMVTSSLCRLLPSCEASQLALLTSNQRWLIYNRVRRLLPSTRNKVPLNYDLNPFAVDETLIASDATRFILTVIQCLERSPDLAAIPLLEDIANLNAACNDQLYLQAAAEHCLEQLYGLRSAADAEGTLLRPTGHGLHVEDDLLRPLR